VYPVQQVKELGGGSSLLLLLEVLVGAVADRTADEDDGVEADAETGRLVVGSRGDGAGKGSLGLGVVGLCEGVSKSWSSLWYPLFLQEGCLRCASECRP
jgi:hypothetical protein